MFGIKLIHNNSDTVLIGSFQYTPTPNLLCKHSAYVQYFENKSKD